MSGSARRVVGGLVAVAALAVVSAACAPAPTPPAGTPIQDVRFRATEVSVVNHNDEFIYGTKDEPFVLNIWFRVKVGVPNSAQTGVVGDRANAFPTDALGDGFTSSLAPNQQAQVDFNDVQALDVPDLLNPTNGFEVIGVWSWAMEKDDVTVTPIATDAADKLKTVLNAVVASGSVPSDGAVLAEQIFGSTTEALGDLANYLFSSIPGIPDDAVGSRIYVGLGARGALAAIMDAALAGSSFDPVEIPVVTVPPDINGGSIFTIGDRSFNDQQFSSTENGRHDYDLVLNNVPSAEFTATPTTGNSPLTVQVDAGASYDPEQRPLTYSWNFGDLGPTASGVTASRTFTLPGLYPVTLTVTDAEGVKSSKTVNVRVNGTPTTKPTNLQWTGGGIDTSAATYADFSWTPVPGAEGYVISMDSLFGCIADDPSAGIAGQASAGRVTGDGLCLGTLYSVRVTPFYGSFPSLTFGPSSDPITITLGVK